MLLVTGLLLLKLKPSKARIVAPARHSIALSKSLCTIQKDRGENRRFPPASMEVAILSI